MEYQCVRDVEENLGLIYNNIARCHMRTKGKKKPQPLPMYPVVSSNVHSVCLHIVDDVETMVVKYHKDIKSDVVYLFKSIDLGKYHEIKDSESVGKAIHTTGIKGEKANYLTETVKP
jgi:hypothetical protein